MKERIDVFAYSEQIMNAMKHGGLLLNTQHEKFNSMVIGWGTLGVNWQRPVFAVYVRESRYTKKQLDETGEFTISVPLDHQIGRILHVCGMQSGRDVDKVKEAGLTLVSPATNHTPGIKEYPLTIECKVIYAQAQEAALFPEDIRDLLYPADDDGKRDLHTTYFGEIVDAYIIR